MSDYTAIRAITLSLREVLRAAITYDSDPQLNAIEIDLRSVPQKPLSASLV